MGSRGRGGGRRHGAARGSGFLPLSLLLSPPLSPPRLSPAQLHTQAAKTKLCPKGLAPKRKPAAPSRAQTLPLVHRGTRDEFQIEPEIQRDRCWKAKSLQKAQTR